MQSSSNNENKNQLGNVERHSELKAFRKGMNSTIDEEVLLAEEISQFVAEINATKPGDDSQRDGKDMSKSVSITKSDCVSKDKVSFSTDGSSFVNAGKLADQPKLDLKITGKAAKLLGAADPPYIPLQPAQTVTKQPIVPVESHIKSQVPVETQTKSQVPIDGQTKSPVPVEAKKLSQVPVQPLTKLSSPVEGTSRPQPTTAGVSGTQPTTAGVSGVSGTLSKNIDGVTNAGKSVDDKAIVQEPSDEFITKSPLPAPGQVHKRMPHLHKLEK